MGKSRTSKTMAAGMALGLTAYSKQFGCRKGGMAEIAAPNRMMRRMLNDIVNIGLHFFLKNVRPYAASCSEA